MVDVQECVMVESLQFDANADKDDVIADDDIGEGPLSSWSSLRQDKSWDTLLWNPYQNDHRVNVANV
ncbi:hypothetical protein DERF_006867 [Dermatophagoides farinae]|uniref:Uncharacterized protein n=1 Tax=Dermatophagoides farinae TaxID=6954 RepID=A0A922HZE0_DERFA|nr:hypothetical protein DERF_006867 [Dermatophagoides farinae]